MPLYSTNPTNTKAWSELLEHYQSIKDTHMKTWFEGDSDRAEKFTIKWKDFYVDCSKNRITPETLNLLLDLAKEMKLAEAIERYFSGDIINETEGRAVLHTALRAKKDGNITLDGQNVVDEVYKVKEKIKNFTNDILKGKRKGVTEKKFNTVVNIGIGGSDLGPAMVVDSLYYYQHSLKTYFISNVDGDHVHDVLDKIANDLDSTLFVIVSKTFSTQETISNATTIRDWFKKHVSEEGVSKHFVAVSTNIDAVKDFGIDEENIFPMWDWVGGRFSLWSAVGLSISLSIGYKNFNSLLKGARKMDNHFRETKHSENIPVILGLLSVWYNNFFKVQTEAVIPYTQYLNQFATYLQQAIMESNGKSVDRNGNAVTYETGTIVWGEPGTNSQHAFFQLIHQGTKLIPTDFIGFVESLHGNKDHHDKLMSNYFAQTEALLNGKTEVEVKSEMAENSNHEKELPFKVFEGNKPTTSILINKLTPDSLGKLIAMYEHKIFVQGVIWNIYSYDQFGVELGKQLAKSILKEIDGQGEGSHDQSTTLLLEHYKSLKNKLKF